VVAKSDKTTGLMIGDKKGGLFKPPFYLSHAGKEMPDGKNVSNTSLDYYRFQENEFPLRVLKGRLDGSRW